MRRNPVGPFYAMDKLEIEDTEVHMHWHSQWRPGFLSKKSGRRRYSIVGSSGSSEVGLRDAPDKWCPVDRASWIHPLPEPLEGQMYWAGNYGVPGHLSSREVEIRVTRALWRSRLVVGPVGWEPDERDRDDEVPACRWFQKLTEDERSLFECRAAHISFRDIGAQLDITGQSAQNRYEKVIEKLRDCANAIVVPRRA